MLPCYPIQGMKLPSNVCLHLRTRNPLTVAVEILDSWMKGSGFEIEGLGLRVQG